MALGLSPLSAQLGKSPDGPEHTKVFLTLEQALSKTFPGADSVWSEVWSPSKEERTTIERRLGWRLADSTFTVYKGVKDNVDLGFAHVSEEIGLYKPITFMVKVGLDREVESVHMMVYRESRGGEVRRRRFLVQYEGKSLGSPIRINRDIIGVTGATLSVRAMNAGVKKTLGIIETAFPMKREK
jgi:thiamine biosynthesis lipoprotein